MAKPHRLSDGTTLGIKAVRTMIGVQLTEVPSRNRPAGSLLWMDGGMWLLTKASARGHGDMVKIRHPEYAYASDEKAAKDVALAFFVDAAEGTIKHAKEESIPVENCY